MFQQSHVQVVEALGVAPVCLISDEDLWNVLVTPLVKGLIGNIERTDPPFVTDKLEGMFNGDEVTNLNDHRLYGGQSGFVRRHYLVSFCKTERGAFIVKRDIVKLEVLCWFGDVQRNQGQLVFKAALKDRRFDGTLRANDCPLLDFPYDDPQANRPIAPGLSSLELSIYGFMPDSRVAKLLGDDVLESFLSNPYRFVDRPRVFLKYFRLAWKMGRAPGQIASPIVDVSRLVMPAFCELTAKAGYDVLEMAASHYHVARWAMREGFRCNSGQDLATLDFFQQSFSRVERVLGRSLSRPQQSWVCVIQSLPGKFIPRAFRLKGPKYPQDNIAQECLWLYKAISPRAKLVLTAPEQPEKAQNAS